MKILINATGSDQTDGFFSYITNLVPEMYINDEINEYVIYSNGAIYDCLERKGVRNLILKSNLFNKSLIRFLWMQFILPFILWRNKIDILFSPLNAAPYILKLTNVKSYLVIHSNLPWLNPKLLPYGLLRAYILKWMKNFSLICSDYIITVSENAKQELVKYTRINQNKIIAVLLGVDHNKFNNKGVNKISRPHEFDYILYAANSAPHHNHITLIDAFNIIARRNKLQLLLIMNNVDNKNTKMILNHINNCSLTNRVTVIPYLDSNDLKKYYTHCSLYIFPSLSETFGLTTIEAMACGSPVIVSNCSAMPEVNGDAAQYFNPNDSVDIAQKIIFVLTNSEQRYKMIKKGFDRAKRFNWKKTANKMIETINAS